jgi:hypothetical protein
MARHEKRSREREAAELAALADGSLAPERRRELEERVASSPRLQAMLQEQRAALRAIRARDERAPERLHAAVTRPAQPRRRRLGLLQAGALAAVAAAFAALVLIALPDSDPAAPTLTEVAGIAARPATSAGPAEAWGLEYPDLERKHRWRTAGGRSDRVDGRFARTVFYVRGDRRMAYTIVSTGPVRVPRGARSWRREGKPWYAFEQDGRTVVAWGRKGHMCVVSVSGLGSRALVGLITS